MKKLGTLALSSAMMLSVCAVPALAAEPAVSLDVTNGVAVGVEGDNGSVDVAVTKDPAEVSVGVENDYTSVDVAVAKDPAEVSVDVENDYATVDVDVNADPAVTVDVNAGGTDVNVGVGKDIYADQKGTLYDGVTTYIYNAANNLYGQIEVIPSDHFEAGGFYQKYLMGYVAFNKAGLTTKTKVDYKDIKNETIVAVDNEKPAVSVTNTNDYVNTQVDVSKDETKVAVNDTVVDVTPDSAEVAVGDVKVAVGKTAASVTVKDVSVSVDPETTEVKTSAASLKVSKTAIKNAIAKIKALFAAKGE